MKSRKVKPFVRRVIVDYSTDATPFIEVLNELGYEVFEDPTMSDANDGGYFIANFDLTYKWLADNAKRFNLDKNWIKQVFADDIANGAELDRP